MLESLKFVQGAVAKKDFLPALTHFRIANGHVLGFNGDIAISCPIALDVEALPKAVPFVRAIERCNEAAALHMTEGRRLCVESGAFKAFVDCYDPAEEQVLRTVVPEGTPMRAPACLLDAMTKLYPIIGIDASREWATGVLFRGGSAYATNNVVVAQYWLGEEFPLTINVPKHAVQEVLRIGEQPTHLMVGERSITFFYEGNRWMRAQLYSTDWPDIDNLLASVFGGDFLAVPTGFFEAVETLTPFLDEVGRLHFRGGRIYTHAHDNEGASVAVQVPDGPCFGAKHLALLKGIAQAMDLTRQPAPFYGGNVRGVVLGLRNA